MPNKDIYIPGRGKSIREFLERGGAYTPENTMQFDEQGNEISETLGYFTDNPKLRGKPGITFVEDLPYWKKSVPEDETEPSVYDKWKGFRKHVIDTRFGGVDPDTFNPVDEAKKAREQYIRNAVGTYGRNVSPQVAKIIFEGADKYANDIVKKKKYMADNSRNELAKMFDWFKEREKPREPKLITGVDARGRPVRDFDVPGARVYEKPEKPDTTAFKTALSQLDKYVAQYNSQIGRLTKAVNELDPDGEDYKKYLDLLNANKGEKAKTLKLKARLLNKEITPERINWSGTQETRSPLSEYGLRRDNTPKGLGYFGELKRPGGGISTELSIGVNIDGKETLIPSLVPTLTKSEINYLLKNGKPTKEIVRKAVEHAKMRIREGKSPFAQETRSPLLNTTGRTIFKDKQGREMIKDPNSSTGWSYK